MGRIGTGVCCASFGELLQGVLPGERKFLVTCRVQNRSRVRVQLYPPTYGADKEARFAESYRRYPKSYKVVRNVMADLGSHDDCFLEIDSDVPVGKGISSSTCDMVGALRGLSAALSIAMRETYIGRMLTEIEPNDGLQYEGTVLYHHTTGELIERFDYVPPVKILGIDTGGILDTVAFNQRVVRWGAEECERYDRLLAEMRAALRARDLETIGRIATESSRRWQRINPKPDLSEVLELAAETEALGVANAHSGTYVGLMYGQERSDTEELESLARKRLPGRETRWFLAVGCVGGEQREAVRRG